MGKTNKEEQKKIYRAILRGIIGTRDNHPKVNISKHIKFAFEQYADAVKSGKKDPIEEFCACISRKSNQYGIKLKETLLDYYKKDRTNHIPYMVLDMVKDFCRENYDSYDFKINERLALCNYLINYYEALDGTEMGFNDIGKHMDNYNDILDEVLKVSACLNPVIDIMCNHTNVRELFLTKDIVIKSVTKTGYSFLKNLSDEDKFFVSYGGELLEGAITLESNIGTGKYSQQDGVLSVVKDKDFFINAVADGVGGEGKGDNASRIAINELQKWFEKIEKKDLENESPETIEFLITNELKNINNIICDRCNGEDSTTIVLALTIGDFTTIANIGDSTAYQYDENTASLIELTTTDSMTRELSYEERRNAEQNNVLTDALGARYYYKNVGHATTIPNDGRRIILSSDGVTDLINEKHFIEYFKNRNNAKEIVMDAVNNPDYNSNGKYSDNVSAIVVNLPKKQSKDNIERRH